MNATILIVQDEPSIQELVAANLLMAGFAVVRADRVETAQSLLRETSVDSVITDWTVSGQSGLKILSYIRSSPVLRGIPVVMLTNRMAEQDKVNAFDAGVDDYITKPFNPLEVIARIRALLRRKAFRESGVDVSMPALSIDAENRRVFSQGLVVDLSPTELRLLNFLMSYPGIVHSRSQLMDRVWGVAHYLEERTVDALVGRLRNVLETVGKHRCIETVRGVGYRFIDKSF